MDAVEINAGTWYLRALRADERISDVPALTALGVSDPEAFVAHTAHDWDAEVRFAWAVCIPTTGELVAVVQVTPQGDDLAELSGLVAAGYEQAFAAAIAPVSRFVDAALGLTVRVVDTPR